jgi:hypothetical protein
MQLLKQVLAPGEERIAAQRHVPDLCGPGSRWNGVLAECFYHLAKTLSDIGKSVIIGGRRWPGGDGFPIRWQSLKLAEGRVLPPVDRP